MKWMVLLYGLIVTLLVCRCGNHASHSSHLVVCAGSAYTEATMLYSHQSTLDDLDGMPESIPKTSERARPKLRKMRSLDASTSSADSGGSIVSRCLALPRPHIHPRPCHLAVS